MNSEPKELLSETAKTYKMKYTIVRLKLNYTAKSFQAKLSLKVTNVALHGFSTSDTDKM